MTLHVGNCIEILPLLPAASVHCCVTSPPYWGLRDYGLPPSVWGGDPSHEHQWGETVPGSNRGGSGTPTDKNNRGEGYGRDASRGQFCGCGAWLGCLGLEPTPELFIEHLVAVFEQVRRVLRDDGTLWLNLGDSYCNAGSSRNGEGLDGKRRGGATGPDGQLGYKHNDKRRTLREFGIKHKDLVGIPWRVALALQAAGWYLRSEIIWHKPNPLPESVRDRPTKAHEHLFLLTKSPRYWYDAEAISVPATGRGLANVRATDKANARTVWSAEDHLALASWMAENHPETLAEFLDAAGLTDVWRLATEPYKGAHFATFPTKLVKRCILAGCPEGGTVLDPFLGSGTTAQVAMEQGRGWIGIEASPGYAELIQQRLQQGRLF